MENDIIVIKIIRFSYKGNESKNIFDKIDGEKSSKDVLTEEEYGQDIEVLMTYKMMSTKSNSSGSIDV